MAKSHLKIILWAKKAFFRWLLAAPHIAGAASFLHWIPLDFFLHNPYLRKNKTLFIMIPLFNFLGPELLVLFFGLLAIVVPVVIIVLITRYFKRKHTDQSGK